MKSVTVLDPAEKRWVVRRRWIPWDVRWRGPLRRRKKDDGSSWLDFIDLAEPLFWFDEALEGFGIALGVILLVVVAVLLLLPLFAFLLEVLIVAAIALLIFAVRVLTRRPWIVEAIAYGPREKRLLWKVPGFRRSGEVVDEIAQQLAAGNTNPSAPSASPLLGLANEG